MSQPCRKSQPLPAHLPLWLTCLLMLTLAMGLAVFLKVNAVNAATPPSGTLSPANPTVVYTAGPFVVPNKSKDSQLGTVCSTTTCDRFTLTVTVPSTYSFTHVIKIQIQWADPAADFDFFVDNSAGNIFADSESILYPEVGYVVPVSRVYRIWVIPYEPRGQNFTATVSLMPVPALPGPPPPAAGVPRYQNYIPPTGMGTSAGEPSIGVNWKSGAVLYQEYINTLRVAFDDCSSPAGAAWVNKKAPNAATSLDPIGFCDSPLGRYFQSQLAGKTSLMAFTDNDGESWTPSQGGGIDSGVDHQTVGGGPYAPGFGLPLPGQTYTHAVYYCSQDVADASCARSDDGGVTFGPAVKIYTIVQCGGLHGHVKVAPNDGTVYVPNKGCEHRQGVVVSTDNGTTWTVRKVPNSVEALSDPSVGIGKNGTVYFGYANGDGHPRIAVSRDRGMTWTDDQDVGTVFNVANTVFPAVVAGDDDRAAFAFLGSNNPAYNQSPDFISPWHLFIAHTYDGGKTWVTVDATPDDPVQRACIWLQGGSNPCRNLLDFMDATVDAQGRTLVGYADGCIGTCVNSLPNTRSALATIARQSGGKRLFVAFDPTEPAVPAAPQLVTGTVNAIGLVHLEWKEPDHGGAALTAYKVYRSISQTSGYALLVTLPPTMTSYDDLSAMPNTTYFYRVSAVNAVGEGPTCRQITAIFVAATNPCVLPGKQIWEDTNDDPPNTPPVPAVDIKKLFVAEPFLGAGVNKLVFTLQVGQATTATVPPNSQWYILWNRQNPDANYDRNYVAMKSTAAGAVSFEYGKITPPSVNNAVKFGDITDASYSPETGIIVISIDNTNVDTPTVGTTLTGLEARTFHNRPVGPVTQLSSSDFSPAGSYVLVGNAACRPNNPPTANLSASPTRGVAPLTVNFDASASSDPDGDTIASYTFDFGDGTPPVTQSTPTVSHTYAEAGEYFARLVVTDSRGAQSVSIASVKITVVPLRNLWMPLIYR